jgi:hypothetical protein
VISTAETVGATTISILAIAAPILCVILVLALLLWAMRKAGRTVSKWRR